MTAETIGAPVSSPKSAIALPRPAVAWTPKRVLRQLRPHRNNRLHCRCAARGGGRRRASRRGTRRRRRPCRSAARRSSWDTTTARQSAPRHRQQQAEAVAGDDELQGVADPVEHKGGADRSETAERTGLFTNLPCPVVWRMQARRPRVVPFRAIIRDLLEGRPDFRS